MVKLQSIFASKEKKVFLFALTLTALCGYSFYVANQYLPDIFHFGLGTLIGVMLLIVIGLGELAYLGHK